MSLSAACALLLCVATWMGGVPVPGGCVLDTGSAVTVITQTLDAQVPHSATVWGAAFLSPINGPAFSVPMHRLSEVGTRTMGWRWLDAAVVPDGALWPGVSCLLGMDAVRQVPAAALVATFEAARATGGME